MGADAKQERVLQGTAQEVQGKPGNSQGARAGGGRITGRFGSIKVSQCKFVVLSAECQVWRMQVFSQKCFCVIGFKQ